MATFRQIRESLGIHEGKLVSSKKEAQPGDWWETAGGNFVGMKKRKKGEKENPTQGYDNEKKAQTYAAGGDPDKEDDSEKDKQEPTPEKEPKEKPKALDTDTLKAKQLAQEIKDSGVGPVMDAQNRIQDIQVRNEFEEDEKEEKRMGKALDNLSKTLGAEDMPKIEKMQ